MRSYINLAINTTKAHPYLKKVITNKIMDKLTRRKNTRIKKNSPKSLKISNSILDSIVDIEILDLNVLDRESLSYVCERYCNHQFDILGTGWVSANINSEPLGFEGHIYKDSSKYIQFESDQYIPIAWNRDIKSGYTFEDDNTGGLPLGVDIKIPWELSRMYHLPQMALGAMIASKNERDLLICEYINQVEDFLENNPYSIGVNWKTAMEVAIRSINILVATDIFIQIDENNIIDEKYKQLIVRMMLEHGQFIIDNLEIEPISNKHGNHYLANLCGLIYISSYIKNNQTKKWFNFASDQFLYEFNIQFLNDGSNYECSTAYHRLSAELSMYSLAMLIRNNVKIPEVVLYKLKKARDFCLQARNNNEEMIQIGDNDSGRVMKLSVIGQFCSVSDYENNFQNGKEYSTKNSLSNLFLQNDLEVYSLMSAFNWICDLSSSEINREDQKIEYSFLKSISNCKKVVVKKTKENVIYSKKCATLDSNVDTNSLMFKKVTVFNFNQRVFNLNDLKHLHSPDFGLVTYYDENFKLHVRLPCNLSKMHCAHLHNDFLHFQFSIGELNFFSDQGSYVYTASKSRRDEFRSAKFHNVPIHRIEQNHFTNFFNVIPKISGETLEVTSTSLGMIVYFENIIHYRLIKFSENKIIVEDSSNEPFIYQPKLSYEQSIGYGKLKNIQIDHFDYFSID